MINQNPKFFRIVGELNTLRWPECARRMVLTLDDK